jgi:uncharacterized HAD superfamily protein
MKTFIIDIDGTICTDSRGRYELARPMASRIQYFNELYKNGNKIIYWTARGGNSGKDWTELTKKQLEEWGVEYTELKMNKPSYDFWIDDKAYNGNRFFDELYF